MKITKRQGAFLAAGLAVTALVVAIAWRVAASSTPPKLFVAPAPMPVSASQPLSTCPVQSTVAAASDKDGKFPLQLDLAGLTTAEIGSFIVIGKESASAGRQRDAEVALLMACRLAEKLKGPAATETADAKYQLAWHYAALTQDGPSAPALGARAEWLWRAQLLYADSLNGYLAKFGEGHEKSRFSAEGLSAVRQALAQMQMPAQAQAVPLEPRDPITARSPVEPQAPQAALQRPAPPRAPQQTAQAPAKAAPADRLARNLPAPLSPSFDCRKARSVPEKIICSDTELAQLDRELGRVYARARHATPNPASFRQRQNEEWLKREATCRDRECLLRWYAHRRDQLMREIEGRAVGEATSPTQANKRA